jgi:hypothetical protein
MRRFIRTFTVKRHEQFSVIQDGDRAVYFIERRDPNKDAPERIGDEFPYARERASRDAALGLAIGSARRMAAEASQRLDAEGVAEELLSPAEELALDARAAEAAQRMSPAEQEARRR